MSQLFNCLIEYVYETYVYNSSKFRSHMEWFVLASGDSGNTMTVMGCSWFTWGAIENSCSREAHVGVNKSMILPRAQNVLDAALGPVHRLRRAALSVYVCMYVYTAWHGVRPSAPRPPHSNGCPNQNLYRVYPSRSSLLFSPVYSLFFLAVLLFTHSTLVTLSTPTTVPLIRTLTAILFAGETRLYIVSLSGSLSIPSISLYLSPFLPTVSQRHLPWFRNEFLDQFGPSCAV